MAYKYYLHLSDLQLWHIKHLRTLYLITKQALKSVQPFKQAPHEG